MKRILSAFAVILAVSCAPAFGQTGDTGIGIIIGEPTGLSIKHFISQRDAIDAGLAWSFSENTNLHLHVDYLRHNRTILQKEFNITEGQLSLYYGVGGRVRADEDDAHVGARFVLGTAYDFADAPFDVFFEIAPIMDLIPETELDANAGLGFRYWFR